MRISDWSSDVCSSDLGEEKQDVVARRTHFLLTRNCGFAELRALDARSAAALRWRGRRFRRAAHGGRRRSPGDRLAEHRNIATCVEGLDRKSTRLNSSN